jgi:hypothetical protein
VSCYITDALQACNVDPNGLGLATLYYPGLFRSVFADRILRYFWNYFRHRDADGECPTPRRSLDFSRTVMGHLRLPNDLLFQNRQRLYLVILLLGDGVAIKHTRVRGLRHHLPILVLVSKVSVPASRSSMRLTDTISVSISCNSTLYNRP